MLESILPALAHGKPTEPELTRAAWLAAILAAVPSGLVMLTGGQSVGDYLIVLLLITIVGLGVFAWGVPSALELRAPGPSVVAVALSGLGLVTVLLFWTGVTPLLALGGVLLGQSQLDVPEDRHRARLAVWVGATAIVLYLLVSVLDLAT
jgi:hypothetical protein